MINLSVDGRYLTVTGYHASPGTATVASSLATSVNRVIGRVDAAGNVDTTTQAAIYSGDNIRSAITTTVRAFGSPAEARCPDKGLYYEPFGGSSATNLNNTISAVKMSTFTATRCIRPRVAAQTLTYCRSAQRAHCPLLPRL